MKKDLNGYSPGVSRIRNKQRLGFGTSKVATNLGSNSQAVVRSEIKMK